MLLLLAAVALACSQAPCVDSSATLNATGLAGDAYFGSAVAALSSSLLAVGAVSLASGADQAGTVRLLSLSADGHVQSETELLGVGQQDGARFGTALAALADLDGDGLPELVVGATENGNGNALSAPGSVYVLFSGSAFAQYARISEGVGGFAAGLDAGDEFGSSLSAMPDMDGDGVPELAVAANAYQDVHSTAYQINGAVYLLYLRANATVKQQVALTNGAAGFTPTPIKYFGKSLAHVPGVGGDGAFALAVGGTRSSFSYGAVFILLLDSSGAVTSYAEVRSARRSHACLHPCATTTLA